MEDKLKTMASRDGFIRLFWTTLAERRQADPHVTQETVFEDMNDYYEEQIGEPRFKSFDAFRKCRDKR